MKIVLSIFYYRAIKVQKFAKNLIYCNSFAIEDKVLQYYINVFKTLDLLTTFDVFT